jgi:hypothetical protein
MVNKKKIEHTRCRDCLFKENDPFFNPPLYPCDICRDRPTRNKDCSQWIPEMTSKEKEKEKIASEEREKRKGMYDY